MTALIGGQSAALLAVVLFGGVVAPMVLGFLGSAAATVLMAPPAR